MSRALEVTTTRVVGTGRDVSLEADERSIAVAFRPADSSDQPESHLLRVVLYNPVSVRLVAQTELGATSMFAGLSLPDALELHAGRLYVVAVPYRRLPPPRNRDSGAPSLGETTVFALELPSLRIARRYVSDASPHVQSRMLRHDGQLFLFNGGRLVELTSDLDLVREQELDGDAPAFGPRGAVLSRRADDDTATCTPAWAALQPLLACGLLPTGARVVRLVATK